MHYNISNLAGGSYYHFGMSSWMKTVVESLSVPVESIEEVSIQINIDGLPLFKSSSVQLWPILGRLIQPTVSKPFVIGIYSGNHKPTDVFEYTQMLVDELDDLIQHGFAISGDGNDHRVPFSLSCIICDTPARAFVKQSKGHSGYFGCDKCNQRGVWRQKVTFPETNAELRTDVAFNEMSNAEHHLGPSPFRNIPVCMVSQFPIDFMHLVCLGVVKRIIWLWMKGPLRNLCRQGAGTIKATIALTQLMVCLIINQMSMHIPGAQKTCTHLKFE